MYPPKLQELIDLFENLSPAEKRENLIALSEQSHLYTPPPNTHFSLSDVKKDVECLDTVAIYLTLHPNSTVSFYIQLGPHVQTLTKALSSILCQTLNNSPIHQIINLPNDFIPKIVGADLLRARSQTVYYVLSRLKSACKSLLHSNFTPSP